jgi:hypothetical protein
MHNQCKIFRCAAPKIYFDIITFTDIPCCQATIVVRLSGECEATPTFELQSSEIFVEN